MVHRVVQSTRMVVLWHVVQAPVAGHRVGLVVGAAIVRVW